MWNRFISSRISFQTAWTKASTYWCTTSLGLVLWGAFRLNSVALNSSALSDDTKTNHSTLNIIEWKRRKIGRYENRIRAFSHPLKVFQYFASENKDGHYFMTPNDFIRSLLPYRDTEDVEEPDERYRRMKTQSSIQFFKLADIDGDGLINYQEYMLFLALLLIPENHIEVAFKVLDNDGNGTLSRQEFTQFIISETEKDRTWFASLGSREHGNLSMKTSFGLMSLLFGEKGDRNLHFDEFMGLMQRLRLELLKLEFYQYKVLPENDSISMRDFAYSMVSYCDLRSLKTLHKKINELPEYGERIGFDQFYQFDRVVNRLDDVSTALSIILPNDSSRSNHSQYLNKGLKLESMNIHRMLVIRCISLIFMCLT